MSVGVTSIFKSRDPSKVTFARRLQMHAYGWGPITRFWLESVKINTYRGITRSTALIKIADKYGKVVLMLEGPQIAVLFGITPQKWSEIEKISFSVGELYYRYYKLGLDDKHSIEQKIFYYFCSSTQNKDVFFLSFKRAPNTRSGNKTDAFLKVVETSLCTPQMLRLYNEKRCSKK